MLDIKDNVLKISVRNLVEFLCQSGDIDNRFGGISDKKAMEAGSKAHRRIQKSMGPEYRSEVPLKLALAGDMYDVVVEGRADGIFPDEDFIYIDEIKGTYRDIRYISEAAYVHKAQAMCYGYFYGSMNKLDKIGIRVTYVNLDVESIKYFDEVFSVAELEEWFNKMIAELRKWGNYIYEHKIERDSTIKELEFPYEYREGQRNLAVNVYKSINIKRNLFIQAPTGVGKTLSTIYPSIKSMAENMTDKIFYLTAKTITRTAAEDSINLLRKNGLLFKSVTITAKDKICIHKGENGPECNPAVCPYAKGHYDRVNDAVYDIITHEDVISRQVIEVYAAKHMVCPFEFCLDITYWMDAVICDYNYAFDPHVCLKRFFSEGAENDYVFLVDEAHNLVDRAREMYSAIMVKEEILEIKRMVNPTNNRKLINALERCNKNLLELKRQCNEAYMILDSDDTFSYNMQRLGEELTLFMEKNRDFIHMKELSEFFFKVNHYNYIHDELDDGYMIYTEHTEVGFTIKLFCVNPSKRLEKCIAKGRNGIFFSATLLPINYYKELLSGNIEDYAIYAHSIFDTNKRKLLIGDDVTSRYTRRNQQEFTKIKKYIEAVITARKGNYLVFFPSYKYLMDVYGLCEEKENTEYIIQQQGMTETDKEGFLMRFSQNNNDKTLVGFCVMGGIFSEGIDLKEDSLIGTIIVGTGLPSIDTRQQLLRYYFDEKENKGYDYAYTFPGMNKVLQAAGRVIRTERDCGVIVLLDDRFLANRYKNLFPREWNDCKITNVNKVHEEILDFWNDMLYNEE